MGDIQHEAAAGQGAGHRLERLFNPRSIALVGASPKAGSVGNSMIRAVRAGRFDGPLHLINPNYEQIEGLPCVPSLSSLETAPDLVVSATGPGRMEEVFDACIATGVGAIVLFDACHGEARSGERLVDALRARARAAGMPVCGGNGMGFFNIANGCHASFYTADHLKPGGITLIAHSGSVFTVLALNDPRYRFNLVVSAGQEIGTGIDEYMDYALDQPETRVIALFMEAARRPAAFAAALEKARDRGIPVVVCKVGRTSESAAFAQSHSGAMTGNDTAYDALFERHGAVRADTVDQLMNAALLLGQGRRTGPGGLGVVTDSGGLREALVDRAPERGVSLARLGEDTKTALRAVLPHTHVADNPVDAAGSINENFAAAFGDSLKVLGAAPEVAMLGYEIDARDDYVYDNRIFGFAEGLAELTDKPCFVYSSFANTHNRGLADGLADRGVPLLNGQDEMLSAVATMMRWRDRAEALCIDDPTGGLPASFDLAAWTDRLAGAGTLPEAAGLALLDAAGVPVVRSVTVDSLEAARAAARDCGYPVVLKTAMPGIAHKSDAGGVHLGIADDASLDAAYRDLETRLGRVAIVQEMVTGGVELAFGCVVDPDFGPLVLVSAGGTLIEYLGDHAHALAPFGPRTAERLLRRLRIARLFEGVRGAAPVDMASLVRALSRFSVLCAGLAPMVREIDVNPVVARSHGCVAVDALVVPA